MREYAIKDISPPPNPLHKGGGNVRSAYPELRENIKEIYLFTSDETTKYWRLNIPFPGGRGLRGRGRSNET
ncbi:hypothetical protein GF338_07105 [candidate division WOR-3 bacterium]|nr:hypothetical protein [candidate division WOR-3 bacterium]